MLLSCHSSGWLYFIPLLLCRFSKGTEARVTLIILEDPMMQAWPLAFYLPARMLLQCFRKTSFLCLLKDSGLETDERKFAIDFGSLFLFGPPYMCVYLATRFGTELLFRIHHQCRWCWKQNRIILPLTSFAVDCTAGLLLAAARVATKKVLYTCCDGPLGCKMARNVKLWILAVSRYNWCHYSVGCSVFITWVHYGNFSNAQFG